MSEHILYEQTDSFVTITFNRPERRNALTVAMYEEIVARLAQAEADDSVRVVLLTGAGTSFTSGNDLADFMGTPPAGPESPVFRLLLGLVDAKKPMIAAVRGHAIGIGVTMLLHCDLIFAADDARFQLPFVNLGLCPEGASSLLMPLMMGHARASELLLLGEHFSAAHAQSVGIVNRVTSAEDLMPAAKECARILAGRPAGSVRLTKELLRHDLRGRIRDALEREGIHFIGRLASPAAMEAFAAFFEKRPPDFRSVGE